MYCMDCGEKLYELNYNENSTKYTCGECDVYWFKTTRTVVEWNKEKIVEPIEE